MNEGVINHCSEYMCPAWCDGGCRIDTCILINPEQAVKEIQELDGGK